jgi:hypothetical protein
MQKNERLNRNFVYVLKTNAHLKLELFFFSNFKL